MKIPGQLPQFHTQKSVIAIVTMHDARFFYAFDGHIEELKEYEIDKPLASDDDTEREGHFEKRGHGEIYGSGSVYERKDKEMKNKFFGIVEDTLKDIVEAHTTDVVHLCIPGHIKNEFQQVLKTPLKKQIDTVLEGNFLHNHPEEILTRLQEKWHTAKGAPVTNQQARDILNKTKKSNK